MIGYVAKGNLILFSYKKLKVEELRISRKSRLSKATQQLLLSILKHQFFWKCLLLTLGSARDALLGSS